MTAPGNILSKLTIAQTEVIVQARQQPGAHAYYPLGWDVHKERFYATLPGDFDENVAFTALYEFELDENDAKANLSTIILSKKDKSYKAMIAITGKYTVYYYDAEGKLNNVKATVPTPVKGLHAVQYKRKGSDMTVNVDGVQILPPTNVSSEPQEMRTYYTGSSKSEPYTLWESHYTIIKPNISLISQLKYGLGFSHEKASITFLNSVQYTGMWTSQDPSFNEGTETIATLKKRGQMSVVLQGAPVNFELFDATSTDPPTIISHPGGPIELKNFKLNFADEINDITFVLPTVPT